MNYLTQLTTGLTNPIPITKTHFHNENAEFHIEKGQIQLQVYPSRLGGGGVGGLI